MSGWNSQNRRWRVSVIAKADRRFLRLRARNSATGQELARSAKTAIRREADRAAGAWEDELNAIGPDAQLGPDLSWQDFTEKYRSEHLQSLARNSEKRAIWTMDTFAGEMHPRSIGSVTTDHLVRFAAKLRSRGVKESTIDSMLGQLRAAFNWAHDLALVLDVPKKPRIQRAKTGSKARVMKGRAISQSEFELMLAAVPAVVGAARTTEWTRLLKGIWLSGLRLDEAVNLHWQPNEGPTPHLAVDLSGRRPLLIVPAAAEKGYRDRLLPMAPDFAEFLALLPGDRTGRVFPLSRQQVKKTRSGGPSLDWVSRTISEIGLEAGVVVDPRKPKYASAHDLRRSFGDRWATIVMPQVLKELMRHQQIETTMRYYVGREAEATSDLVHAALERSRHASGDTPGDTSKSNATKTS